MKLHTESVEADAPLFHPNLWGRLIPDEVLQNKSTTELHDFHLIPFSLEKTFPVSDSHLNIQSRMNFEGENESKLGFCYSLYVHLSLSISHQNLTLCTIRYTDIKLVCTCH